MKHPNDVGVPKPLLNRIGIFIGVDESVVVSVVVTPLERASLRCDASEKEEDRFDDGIRLKCRMGVEAMVAGGDCDAGGKYKGDCYGDQRGRGGMPSIKIDRERKKEKEVVSANKEDVFPCFATIFHN